MEKFVCKSCDNVIKVDTVNDIPKSMLCKECESALSGSFKTAYFGTPEDLLKRVKRKDKLKKFKLK